MNYLPFFSLITGGWMVLNGVLHDIAVLRSGHGKNYDRNLLRLLMDGHILITCGVMQMLSFPGMKTHAHWAYYVAGASSLSLLVYCFMIFPFLKSLVTMMLNAVLLVCLIISF